MKLMLAFAKVKAVTPLMLKQGSGEDATKIPAKALTLNGEIAPEQLDELRAGLSNFLFLPQQGEGPRVPAIPEVEELAWNVEYAGGELELDLTDVQDLDFADASIVLGDVSMKDIVLKPLKTGMVDIKLNAVFETDQVEIRGKLDGLLSHTVSATFSKLSQKPLIEPEKPKDDAASRQGELVH